MHYLWNKNDIPLYNKEIDNIHNQNAPSVTPFISDGAKSCVLICPGGGYGFKSSNHEGEQIAGWLNSIGVSAFVLDYRVAPYQHPAPLLDGKRAIRYLRYTAEKYGYNKNKIGILGFSAGAHLAGSVGTFKGDFGYEKQDEIDEVSSRPDFMILCYPVISFVEYAHIGSMNNLAGNISPKDAQSLSVDKNVDNSTPPTFLWHTSADTCVPVENSLKMAWELSRHNVPFEIHTFKDGPHGLGLAQEFPHTAKWIEACKNWLESMHLI